MKGDVIALNSVKRLPPDGRKAAAAGARGPRRDDNKPIEKELGELSLEAASVGVVRNAAAKVKKLVGGLRQQLSEARRSNDAARSEISALALRLKVAEEAAEAARQQADRFYREFEVMELRAREAEERAEAAADWIRDACAHMRSVHGGVPDWLKR